jgi:RHS repeat-associated protein
MHDIPPFMVSDAVAGGVSGMEAWLVGSTRHRTLTDSSGAVVDQYAYDPYGNITTQVEKVSNPLRWIGAIWDSALQLYKLGQRYYAPALGRFTQPDRSDQSVNRFVYAGDDPVNSSDPDGNFRVGWCWWGILIVLSSWDTNWLTGCCGIGPGPGGQLRLCSGSSWPSPGGAP